MPFRLWTVVFARLVTCYRRAQHVVSGKIGNNLLTSVGAVAGEAPACTAGSYFCTERPTGGYEGFGSPEASVVEDMDGPGAESPDALATTVGTISLIAGLVVAPSPQEARCTSPAVDGALHSNVKSE